MKKSIVADIALVLITIIWGSSFGITKTLLNGGMSPISLNMFRSFFTVILLSPIFIIKYKKIKSKDILFGIKLGSITFFGFILQTVGADMTSGSNSAFLTTLSVIFVPIILFITTKQKLSISNLVASLIALTGTAFMTLTLTNQSPINLGDILTIICSVFWALQIIKTSEYAKKTTDVSLLMFFQFVMVCFLSFLANIIFRQSFSLTIRNSFSILYLTVFCTIIAFFVQAIATKYTTPERASIIFTFEGFFGALFSFLIVQESLSLRTIIGGLLILFALIISEGKYIDQFINVRRKRWEEKELKRI